MENNSNVDMNELVRIKLNGNMNSS